MSTQKIILPCKVQLGDEVTYELGTTEVIKAIVKSVMFDDTGEICYDLAIEKAPHTYTRADKIPSGCVNAIKASAYQPSFSDRIGSADPKDEKAIIHLVDDMCAQSLPPDQFGQWEKILKTLKQTRSCFRDNPHAQKKGNDLFETLGDALSPVAHHDTQ